MQTTVMKLGAMTYTASRLAEAYTATSSAGTKITDVGLSYSVRGEISNTYQATQHMNANAYNQMALTYWANGVPDVLGTNISGLPAYTYNVDSEGRPNTVSASAGTNPVSGTSYNYGSQPTGVTFGSGDSDAFSYDPNTGRPAQYQFNVNSQSVTGALAWNPNSTLQQLAITDPFNSTNSQTCAYVYDDLARISSANCGSAESSIYSYDAFGNIAKTGSFTLASLYTNPTTGQNTNLYISIAGTNVTYDANGNVLNDTSNQYTWDAEGRPVTIDSVGVAYDALGRMAEQNRSGNYTQIVYAPTGKKFALMSSATLQKAFVPLPASAQAIYTSSGLTYFRHPDWLGSSRFASTTTPPTTMYSDTAYAPFGEPYAQAGTTDLSFTGQNQDTVAGGLAGPYDFPAREYSPQGRWVSPDPAGLAAVDPTNPQSWNRYAYVLNNPLVYTDPTGLYPPGCDPDDPDCCDPWTGICGPCPWGGIFCPVPAPGGGGGGGGGGGSSSGSGATPIPGPPINVGSPIDPGSGPIWSEQVPISGGPINPWLIIQNLMTTANGMTIGSYAWEQLCINGVCLPLFWDPSGHGWRQVASEDVNSIRLTNALLNTGVESLANVCTPASFYFQSFWAALDLKTWGLQEAADYVGLTDKLNEKVRRACSTYGW